MREKRNYRTHPKEGLGGYFPATAAWYYDNVDQTKRYEAPCFDVLAFAVQAVTEYWSWCWMDFGYQIMPNIVTFDWFLTDDSYGCWSISQTTRHPVLRLFTETERWELTWEGKGGLAERLTTDDDLLTGDAASEPG